MDCDKYERLIQLHVDRQLDPINRQLLQNHIQECKECKEELKSMILLVSTIERIGLGPNSGEKRRSFLGFPAIPLVITSVMAFLLVYMFPILPILPGEEGNRTSIASPIVLADESEVLPFPHEYTFRLLSVDDYLLIEQPYTTWIYPSAMITIVENEMKLEVDRRYIFVGIPNDQTWAIILSKLVGIESSTGEHVEFPSSFIVNPGSPPEVVSFSFPKDKEGLTEWFNEMSRHVIQ